MGIGQQTVGVTIGKAVAMMNRSWNLIYASLGSIIGVALLCGAFWSANKPLRISNVPIAALPAYVGAMELNAFLAKPIIAASRSLALTDKKEQPDFDITEIELTGIILQPANKMVIYFNYRGAEHKKEVTENDVFSGWTVSKITHEKITLSQTGKLYTLNLEGSK